MLLNEVPYEERPREKYLELGIESLSNLDLVAILLRTGTKNVNVMDVAKEIVYRLEGIGGLKDISLEELMDIKGIGKAKAITIIAAVELGKRIALLKRNELKMNKYSELCDYFYKLMKDYKQEVLEAIYFDIKGNVISIKEICKGGIDSVQIDKNVIFKWYYKHNASYLMIIHNHPSGDSMPSLKDIQATKELIQSAKILNINFLDHIIIGNIPYSFKRETNVFNL